MPRRLRVCPKRRTAGVDELDEDLRDCLEWWEGCLGVEPSLKTLDDWRNAWERWSGVVLPEFLEAYPGCRPAAMYAAGLLPPRPLLEPLPAAHGFLSVFVADGTGGQWHYKAWEPFVRCEGAFLLEHGVIDRAEYRRHLRSDRGHAWRCVYPWGTVGGGRSG